MMHRLKKPLSMLLGLALIGSVSSAALAAPSHQDGACTGTDYSVQANDWLSKLAEKNLGDVLAFPQIVEATNVAAASDSSYTTIANPDVIEVGWKICIPTGDGMVMDEMMVDEAMDEAMMDEASDSADAMMAKATTFTVRVENVSGNFTHAASGVFNTPAGADGPGPLLPGNAYEATFYAAPGEQLSFASMLVQSNDWFIANGTGIDLFDADGNPFSGDVTAQVGLYDAGTEIDQTPAAGADQAPRQTDPNTGEADSDNTVRQVSDDSLPTLNELVTITVEAMEYGAFKVTLTNISDSSSFATPFAPGVWVVHTAANPLFTVGSPDAGLGLEALAEDGNPAGLAGNLAAISGRATPFAPVAWVVSKDDNPLFTAGAVQAGIGLEDLAEYGNPGILAESVGGSVANTPVGADSPNAITPGEAYEFSVEADSGSLYLALMYVQSNDLFFAPGNGIALFDAERNPVSGDVTAQISLWDAGTEVNQAPGFGPDQAPRQADSDAGTAESGAVQPIADGFSYGDVSQLIQVTIIPQ